MFTIYPALYKCMRNPVKTQKINSGLTLVSPIHRITISTIYFTSILTIAFKITQLSAKLIRTKELYSTLFKIVSPQSLTIIGPPRKWFNQVINELWLISELPRLTTIHVI